MEALFLMEIDHIDKDNIRVFLVHKDLEERGVTILDLLGNQMQVEKFFYSILEEVDIDRNFSGTQSITFQVMPNEEGLELLISKTPQNIDKQGKSIEKKSRKPTDFFDFKSNRKSKLKNSEIQSFCIGANNENIADSNSQRYLNALEPDEYTYVATFHSIDDLIDLGQFLNYKVKTQLYILKDNYYATFTLYKKDSNPERFMNLVTNINEYGYPGNISPDLLLEHGKLLIKNNIFKTLDKYF